MLFVIVGVAWTIRAGIRRSTPDNLGPELLGGLLVSWVAITLIRHKDVRFMLPALVYLAVLGTGWIATARPRVRVAATAAVGVTLVVDFLAVSIGIGHAVRIALPGAPANSGLYTRQITLYSPDGYIRGGPESEGDILGLMRGLKRAGVRTITFEAASTDVSDFTTYGLTVRAIQAGLRPTARYDLQALGPHDGFMLRRVPQPGDPAPCQRLRDGSGVYVELGNPVKPFQTYTFVCPGRRPEVYTRPGPLPASITHVVAGEPRQVLLKMMRALRRHGVRLVEFNPASVNAQYFDPAALTRLAESVGLARPSTYQPSKLGPRDAFLLLHVPDRSVPPPCGTFPDGNGLYAVLGSPLIPLSDYRFYCPWRRPSLALARPSGSR
jgi:hypothetical protein